MQEADHLAHFENLLRLQFGVLHSEWDQIREYVQIEEVSRNEYFVKQGKVCHRLGFICEGVFRICMERDGTDITCYFVCEDNFVGDPESFKSRTPSKLNMQALTDAIVITFDRKLMTDMPRFPEIITAIDKKVMMGLLAQRDFIQNEDAATKYQKFLESYPHILQRVPLGIVASFLGITQQSLSRLRKNIS
ncbi:MAG: Crp/Fnr family transcriptional regulator [Bacteroidetes bacterium]|nr:MAG: Crp/Fnr family transcriptional regulator [Bacteroidota bacterium]